MMETEYWPKTRGQNPVGYFRHDHYWWQRRGLPPRVPSQVLVAVAVRIELVAMMWLADVDVTANPAERFRSPISHRRALTCGERHPALAWTSTRWTADLVRAGVCAAVSPRHSRTPLSRTGHR